MRMGSWCLFALSVIAFALGAVASLTDGQVAEFGPQSWWRLSVILVLWGICLVVLHGTSEQAPAG